ncbi:MAG: hypothetical protein CVU89_02320 [Firmicutes bacterium HGW-Firmicutes-14]|nr:MAG: hypothetical protein CVU89_02320 [Firmicutes bacterium HGW-Firmicutes-14]
MRKIRIKVGILICTAAIFAAAVGGAYLLGEFYLDIIKKGYVHQGTRVSSDGTESVVAEEEEKTLFLNPIPVYYLQAGVYSDMAGARQAAKPLEEMGLVPYITNGAPYRIWIGVFQKRSDAEPVKQILREKGISSFTGSVVINGSNLKYSKGREVFIRQVSPVLEAHTNWLKENLDLFHADCAERLNMEVLREKLSVVDSVYKDIESLDRELDTNSGNISRQLEKLRSSVTEFHKQLFVFRDKGDQDSYALLQFKMLAYIDNYLTLWWEIDNISKT